MLRRTFLTLLGAVTWPWRKKQVGPTSSSFTIPASRVHWIPRDKRSDYKAFHLAIAETRPVNLQNPGGHPVKFIPVRDDV